MIRRRLDDVPDVDAQVIDQLGPLAVANRRLLYLAIAELQRRHASPEEPDPSLPLSAYELKVFSQNGEDGVLVELLRRCGSGERTFVEIGAGDGSEGTCVALADLFGWTGVFVEGGEAKHAALAERYAHRPVRALQAIVTPDNVRELLAGVQAEVLSIDIDGPDYWIWKELDFLRPRVVVVEYNASLDPDAALTVPRDHVEPWDGTAYFGASLGAFVALGRERGYRLVHTDLTGTNAFFVREDVAHACPAPEVVPRFAANYGLVGLRHRPDPHGRPFVTL